MGKRTMRTRQGIGRLFPFAVLLLLIALGQGCGAASGSTETNDTVYDLAHNTERKSILEETAAVLLLNNYTIEYSDDRRNQAALMTYWRMASQTVFDDSAAKTMWVRDRAILHITPRGRSTVVQNAYLMVNATLEFDVQRRVGDEGAWERIIPAPASAKFYSSMVKDIRTRMLKYHFEL